ncbi:MAG TPA: SDR family oxidoreductase [Edaphocola sp.]|nr:SDR family oxidoreductase [Edaphocola sp.]
MKILIVGASGLVGGNCLKHFIEEGHQVIGTHMSYATNHTVFFNTLKPNIKSNFDVKSFQPDVIVHCGALTHVDYCEEHIKESYEKTVKSTKNIIKLAKEYNSKLVYLSTDYVFDGKKGPYRENAPTHPINIYGKHKLMAEKAVLKELTNSLVLRITNVYGEEERGKNFVSRIINQCKEGKQLNLKLPFDQYASPTHAWDIARAMLLLLEDQHSGIFHIGGTDYMNRVDLALRILKYFPETHYELITADTESLGQTAPRPLMGGFIKAKFSSLYPKFIFSTVDEYVLRQSLG